MEQFHLWFPEALPHFLHVWKLVAQTASSPGSEAICSSPLAPAHLHQHPLGTAFLFFKSCLRPLFCWKWEGSCCRHHSSSSPPQAPLTTVLHTLGKGESRNKAIPAPSNHFSSIFGMCQHQPTLAAGLLVDEWNENWKGENREFLCRDTTCSYLLA